MTDSEYLIQFTETCPYRDGKGIRRIGLNGDFAKLSENEANRVIANGQGILSKGNLEIKTLKIYNALPKKLPNANALILTGDAKAFKNPARIRIVERYLEDNDIVLVLASYTESVFDTKLETEANSAFPTGHILYPNADFAGIKNNASGKAFYTVWLEERENGVKHALSRALYRTTPTIKVLPPDWLKS